MSKRKLFLKDIVVNTVAFGVYMVAHHIIMLPYLAKVLPVEVNAQLLLFLMLASIYTASFGNEFGVLYQVRMGRNPGDTVFSDVYRLLHWSNLLLIVISIPLLLILDFSMQETLALTFITLLWNIRMFYHSVLRHRKQFKAIFVSNLGYLLGVAAAIVLLVKGVNIYWLPLMLGEILSTLIALLKDKEFMKKTKARSSEYKVIRKEGLNLVGAAVLGNIPSYGDKILVLPLLGSSNMSAYYAGNSLSKGLMLLVNPVNGVLLSWLSTDAGDNKRSLTKRMLRANLIIVIALALISYPLIYLATYLLYRQFLDVVLAIIIPLAISAAFSTGTTVLKVIFLRYYKISAIKYINLLKIILFTGLALLGAYLGGLLGFTIAIAVSNCIIWLIYFFSMFRSD
ncbi:MAG: hypothetical protein GX763_07375 [Clostridiaceae bacterium]|nr:hypothetical protein [Clostridiaceae bacterium]